MFGRYRLHNGRSGGLADRSRAGLHRQQFTPHHSHPGSQCGRASKPGALLTEVQTGCWRLATCLRCEEASGESLPSDDDQCGTTERNSLERGLFGSGTSMPTVQTGLWPKSGPLATRARNPWRGHLENRHQRKNPASDQHGKVLSRPFRVCESQAPFVSSVATTETLEEWYRAYDGNDAPDDLGRKSPRRTQFPLTGDPSEPTSAGRVRLAFA
jgi:hypothetical protein